MEVLIKKTKKLTILLQELKEIQEVNNYEYLVRSIKLLDQNLCELIEVKTGKLIKVDKKGRIESYLNIRNLTNKTIFKIKQ